MTVLSTIAVQPLDATLWIGLLLIALLLMASALMSGSEQALFALTPQDREALAARDDKAAQAVVDLLHRPKRLLATLLIGNNLVNVAIVLVSSFLMENLFSFGDRTLLAFLVQVVAVTATILVFGEIMPKVYASRNALSTALFAAKPVALVSRVFAPLAQLLVSATNTITQRLQNSEAGNITASELSQALELTSGKSAHEHEQKILHSIVRFGAMEVSQVMTPRIDVVALEANLNFSELREQIITHGYSRLPIIRESLDKVVGILYTKDLLPHLHAEASFDWQALLRPAVFVTENKKLDDLLREFQESKNHLAIVVDEYGGSSGLISLEDILEEIVGEISDEYDDEDLVYTKLDDSNYLIEGKTTLMNLYRLLKIDGREFEAAKGDSETLAGFVLEITGRIPQKNERIPFNNHILTIEAADRRRIKMVKLTLGKPL